MSPFVRLLAVMLFLVLLASPRAAHACPSCQAAVKAPSGSEDFAPETDPFREARAYHLSVYLMVGMPYLLLGTVGLLVYRAFKQKEAADLAAAGPTPAAAEVHDPCPDLSHGDRL